MRGRPLAPKEPGADPLVQGEFSIGEAAALVGVSPHVIRSWERRLALNLSRRTITNQRRYRLEDIQRMIAIRRLHTIMGLPLAESASRVMSGGEAVAAAEQSALNAKSMSAFWAALSDTLPELLVVVDRNGKVVAENKSARNLLNTKRGQMFDRVAPSGWRQAYRSLYKSTAPRRQPVRLAMDTRSGVVYVDATVAPVTRGREGQIVIFGQRVSPAA